MAWSVQSVAAELLACEDERRERVSFAEEWPELDVSLAYEIQDATLEQRLQRGERLIGVKLGLTSKAKQERMNVDVPFVAWLTDAMVLAAGEPVPQDRLIHPRLEPEIVLVMGTRLEGPGVTAAQAREAVGAVKAGVEIIDSRYQDFRFTAADVIADNASSGAFVVGHTDHQVGEVDLVAEAVVVEVDGTQVDNATGAAVLGDPAEALALAANELAKRGLAIEAGWIVLTGGMTDAYPITPGTTITCSFDRLGSIAVEGGTAVDRTAL
jgi:2-oxo-3-hexenedioate decarboxylase